MVRDVSTKATSQMTWFNFGWMFVAGLLVSTLTAKAADANRDVDRKPPTPDRDMAYLMASNELARIARESKDPILMLASAHLEAIASIREVVSSKTAEGGVTAGAENRTHQSDLYAMAEKLAGTNDMLQDLIKSSRASTGLGKNVRARADAPLSTLREVGAGVRDEWTETFNGGEAARLVVLGKGNADLDLYIYDENSNEICAKKDERNSAYCSWYPKRTGDFTIRVENVSTIHNEYRVLTN